MAKNATQYVCQSCGSVSKKWAGQCTACGEWNSITEEVSATAAPIPKGMNKGKGRVIDFVGLRGDSPHPPRSRSGMEEFDRVCGGGLVQGSVLLIGGDPGIGKSTILLQIAARLSDTLSCVYITGEEAIDQVRLRAERLGVDNSTLQLASATNIRDILTTMESPDPRTGKSIGLVVIDSIQTMYIDNIDSAPGTVSQLRACSAELIRVAKQRGIILVLVGHVTKDGAIAGPRVLEHMVDTVLYFEGDRGHQFRILRSVKNRFGATDEIGVFEMTEKGLSQVSNPSELFLAERATDTTGSVVLAGMEGTRPVLVEIQALVSSAAYGTPRRAVIGWDSNRLAMIVAVLEARCGLNVSGNDIYLNVAGGLRITEPAADLAVAAALVSSFTNRAFPSDTVVFGEVGLSGEVRAVSQAGNRLKEAAKLGFKNAICPTVKSGKKDSDIKPPGGLSVLQLKQLSELLPFIQNGC